MPSQRKENMKNSCILMLLLLGIGCERVQIPEGKNKIAYDIVENYSRKNISYHTSFLLDTLYFSAKQASMEGDFLIKNDTLYFVDRVLSSVLVYDKEGVYIRSALGFGRGENEIPGLNQMTTTERDRFIILDKQWFIYLIDSNLNVDSKFFIRWDGEFIDSSKFEHPDPNNPNIYEVEYGKNKIVAYDEYLFFPVVTEHVKFNAYGEGHTPQYYSESFNLAKLSLKNGRIEQLLCNYPPVYKRYRYLSNFKYILFDLYRDSLFFSFEVDTLVYRMNMKDSTVISFGNSGVDMDTAYPEFRTFEDSDIHFSACRQNYGYYRYLKWIPQTNVLFRGYQKQKAPFEDGLQVYRNRCLVADFNVPRGFEVIGYIAPWYYAGVKPDYANEKFIIYRFKL